MRVAVVGFGQIGQFIINFIEENGVKHDLQLACVWNRSLKKLYDSKVSKGLILENLDEIGKFKPDLIVEVAHPVICKVKGAFLLSVADLMIGSPSILSDSKVEQSLYKATQKYNHGLYVPVGAMWGSMDIQKMATLDVLKGLKIKMSKHPSSFRLFGPIKEKNDQVLINSKATSDPVVLFEGSVRQVCQIAPVNVNTMAVACIAAHNLGFDKVLGCIIADPNLKHWHVINIEVTGLTDKMGNTFTVNSIRKNPALPGAVTGKTTLTSICSSLVLARGKGSGVHLC